MKRSRLPKSSSAERVTFFAILWGLLFLASTMAFAESRPKRPRAGNLSYSSSPKTLGGSYGVAKINPISSQALSTTTPAPAPARIVNLRIHPTHLATMIIDKDTIVSVRGDLDFILGERVTLGPSVIYHQTSSFDDGSRVRSEALLEAGILSNIYLTGRSSEGGFLLRPHVYYSDPNGSRTDDAGNPQEFTAGQSGVRGGAEILFQHILPSGFNFEIGGGVTYHFKPYSLEYAGNGTNRTEPSSRLVPTISLAVGLAL